MTGIHYTVIQANSGQYHPSATPFLTLMGAFLVAMAVWMISFIRHFTKVPN